VRVPNDVIELLEKVDEEESKVDKCEDAGRPKERLVLLEEKIVLEHGQTVVYPSVIHHEEYNSENPAEHDHVAGPPPNLKLNFIVRFLFEVADVDLSEDDDGNEGHEKDSKNEPREPNCPVAHFTVLTLIDSNFFPDVSFQLIVVSYFFFPFIGVEVLKVEHSNVFFDFLDLVFKFLEPAVLPFAESHDFGLISTIVPFIVVFEDLTVFTDQHLQVLRFDVEIVKEDADFVGD
jgi:hypothetical protein